MFHISEEIAAMSRDAWVSRGPNLFARPDKPEVVVGQRDLACSIFYLNAHGGLNAEKNHKNCLFIEPIKMSFMVAQGHCKNKMFRYLFLSDI